MQLLEAVLKYSKKQLIDELQRDALCRGIGDGFISCLKYQYGAKKLLAIKTPRVRDLKHFLKLFSEAYLIILVCDGRAVVES